MPDKRAKIYKALEHIPKDVGPSVFLSGPIADDWRGNFIRQLEHMPVTIFDPLRTDWDSSWTERKTDKRFYEQVKWELDAQERADIVAVYLHPGNPSPTTLLELGLVSPTGQVVVCCPDGFYVKGNVEIVCERYNIPLVVTIEDLVRHVTEKLELTALSPLGSAFDHDN